MSGKTPLQKDIISILENDLTRDAAEIAEEAECSTSYVRKVKNDYLPEIYGENDIKEYNIGLSFSAPHSIQVKEGVIEELNMADSEIAEITIETFDQTQEDIACCINDFNQIDVDTEVKSLTYALERLGEDLPNPISGFLDDFSTPDKEYLDIYNSERFGEFLERIKTWVKGQIASSDILIGAQILASEFNSPRSTDNVISTPELIASKKQLQRLLSGDEKPRLIDLRNYQSTVHEPDEVFFTHTTRDDVEEITSEIDDLAYLDPSVSFRFGDNKSVVGPEVLESYSGNIIEVNSDSITFVETCLDICFVEENEKIDINRIEEIAEGLQISIPDSDETYTIEKRGPITNDSVTIIELLVNSVHITLSVGPGYLAWSRPDIEFVNDIVERLNDVISDHLSFNNDNLTNIDTSHPGEEINTLIFDTNAIYHEIVDKEPSSILKSIFPLKSNTFHNSKTIIPWSTRYEINKHKDVGGPPPAVQEKGIDNLRILKVLDEYGFLSLEVEEVPNNLSGSITESHVADMSLLQCAERESDAALITGDQRLRELASLSNTRVMNIYDLAQVDDRKELDEELDENVVSEIGDSLTDRDEILSEVESIPENRPTEIRGAVESIEDPESYLNRWLDEEEIMRYYDKDSEAIKYNVATTTDAVLSPTAATKLTEYIKDTDSGKYITNEGIEKLSNVIKIPDRSYPKVTFHVPISNVIAPQSTSLGGISTDARNFYKISQLINANYSTDELQEATTRGEYVHDSVLLARERSYPILCTENEDFLLKIAGLLGVQVVEF